MSNQELILNTIKMKGPVIPNQIAKVIETDILFASAHLSELTSSNKLKISNTKIGSSPVYYLPGQESRLQELYKYLNDKQQKSFNLLKEKKILRDSELPPIVRVALRAIKDFAVPLQITTNNNKILFWKWYLLSNDEAGTLIKLKLQPEKTKEKIEEKPQERIEQKNEIKTQPKQEIKKQEPEIIQKEHRTEISEPEQTKPIEKQIKLKPEEQEKKTSILKRLFKPKEDVLLKTIQEYFDSKRIKIIEYSVIRKNSEIDAIVQFPSVIGELEYYCKAKNKKSINEMDLTNALAQGQFKKLPVLFLIKGDLSKKAEELLNTEFKKGLIIHKI